ncbi:hypothetical protein ACQP1O_23730 [Nocardia sp. CA-151230]|uniref:hypothetical protein n=1 Tax=Nocardia sp. CA-151230 TaxID=3239982 RepID=UPI003D92D76C
MSKAGQKLRGEGESDVKLAVSGHLHGSSAVGFAATRRKKWPDRTFVVTDVGPTREPASTDRPNKSPLPRVVSLTPYDRPGAAPMQVLAYVPTNFNKPLRVGDTVVTRMSKHGAHKGLPGVHLRVVGTEPVDVALRRHRRESDGEFARKAEQTMKTPKGRLKNRW